MVTASVREGMFASVGPEVLSTICTFRTLSVRRLLQAQRAQLHQPARRDARDAVRSVQDLPQLFDTIESVPISGRHLPKADTSRH